MRYFFIFLFLITCTSGAFAQFDTGKGGISIPRAKNPVSSPAPAATPSGYVSPFKIEPKKEFKSTLQVGGDTGNTSVMFQKNEYVSRGSEYQDRTTIKQRGESNEEYRGNRDFGEFKTKSLYLNIMARDFGAEDGDRIKITLNGRVIISDVTLNNNDRATVLTLEPGFNHIEIEALNQGTSGPNTAEFKIFDDKEALLSANEWNLATGFKATFLFIKE
jgi:hypothetical protein